MAEPTLSAIPQKLSPLISPPGYNRRGMKALVFGMTGGGKSFFGASAPRPLAAIDCGEGGIQGYLLPPEEKDGKPVMNLERVARGEEDVCFHVESPQEYQEALNWILQNDQIFASTVVDGFNLQWEDHMDFWNEKLGGDILAGDWRKVKGPWKANLRSLLASKMNVVFTAWLKDIDYSQSDAAPGMKAKLQIKRQEVAQVEKSVPYIVDLVLQASVVLDSLNQPTPKHEIKLLKARRPLSIPANELYVGKTWKFNAKQPASPWDEVVAPLMNRWDSKAIDYLGMDQREAKNAEIDLNVAASDGELGRLALLLDGAKNLQALKRIWDESVDPALPGLTPAHRVKIIALKNQKKEELNK